ncbi:MAG: hypothetical protein JRF59_12305 [Deltaproteobacteria bacterium]|nr:hypothetical protein [Deltaproteobacteria bacterium]MBW1921989.1 hypothetical protein [Deltaproteobacteria bacterium]MBW1950157.1 hypothetical protein [Deltaproteobacteria bacterium]MBW2008119.1 hypothetical protein [Deltaproteobacteria bacterium]MBW2102968.1 hypothetical protein [Deltaproteobacteria bacterium]
MKKACSTRPHEGCLEQPAALQLPREIMKGFLESVGSRKGIYGLSPPLREWLGDGLGVR